MFSLVSQTVLSYKGKQSEIDGALYFGKIRWYLLRAVWNNCPGALELELPQTVDETLMF